jgi:hypothetical protein
MLGLSLIMFGGTLLLTGVGKAFVAAGGTNRLLLENSNGLLFENSSGDVALE